MSWTVDGKPAEWGAEIPSGVVQSGQRWSCTDTTGSTEVTVTPWGGNLLIVLMDDVGVDKIGAYDLHPTPASTPVMDSLAAEGIRFDRAYSEVYCSSTRSTALTGRHPRRTGIGFVVDTLLETEIELSTAERTLPEVMVDHGYSTAAFGKWHIAGINGPSGLEHPMQTGFQHFQGPPGNLNRAHEVMGMPGYYNWDKNDDGVLRIERNYATTDTIDDAVAHLDTMPEPWLMWIGFNAAHSPYEAPPEALVGALPSDETPDIYDAMIRAMDTELGRLLDAMPPEVRANTTVVVMGDNGTPGEATRAPTVARDSKGSLREGGVRVPLIVTGPMVSPGTSNELVHVADLFGLASELVGEPLPDNVDAVSPLRLLVDPGLESQREYVWYETFQPLGHGPYTSDRHGIADATHKLTYGDGFLLFFRIDGYSDVMLNIDDLEPDDAEAYARLSALRATYTALGPD